MILLDRFWVFKALYSSKQKINLRKRFKLPSLGRSMPKESIKDKKIKEKEEKRREKEVHICPNCGSVDLQGALTLSPIVLSRYIAENNKQLEGLASNEDCFLCQDCDFLNICPKVKIKDVERFQGDLKTHKVADLRPRKKLTPFQIFLSFFVLAYMIVSYILIFLIPSYSAPFFLISIPIIFVIFFIWIAYSIFKKQKN